MKKNIIIKLAFSLLAVSAISGTVFADEYYSSVSKDCSLGSYCPLSSSGDKASFSVLKSISNDYSCTLFGGLRPGKKREVSVKLTGSGDYNMAPLVLVTKEGSHNQIKIKGNFNPNSNKNANVSGKINALRLSDSIKKPNDVMILCDK